MSAPSPDRTADLIDLAGRIMLTHAIDPRHLMNLLGIDKLDAETIIRTGETSVAAGDDWHDRLQPVREHLRAALPGPFASTVMCALALKLDGPEGLDLALSVFEAVFTSARRYSLHRDCDRWLEQEIPSTKGGWSVQTRLCSAAVEAWPPRRDGAGVLLLCSQPVNASDLIDDVMVRYGRSALEMALLDSRLPRTARDRVKQRLSPPKLRIGWFGF